MRISKRSLKWRPGSSLCSTFSTSTPPTFSAKQYFQIQVSSKSLKKNYIGLPILWRNEGSNISFSQLVFLSNSVRCEMWAGSIKTLPLPSHSHLPVE